MFALKRVPFVFGHREAVLDMLCVFNEYNSSRSVTVPGLDYICLCS